MTRVLVVDNYDSFVWTIVGYLEQLGATAVVQRNDDVTTDPRDVDAVLVSPGPGTPKGAGVTLDVIAACAEHRVPMLGVCLGHQALGELFGATVTHAPELMHGKTSLVEHDGTGVFAGLPTPFTATRYHSLTVDPATVPDTLRVTARTANGIVMGLEHRDLPLHGVQFHPESVLTDHGHRLLANWLTIAGDREATARSEGLAPLVRR
ncbi:aminodeoxychorismate/anthranilate synthase component II [Georgenia sp. 311]|uniref:Aminodeoxychorismate/anthranilate synthase component II n=1 Tax=Georgenia wutianyii TaxID=2585135 RepID=A0ABX5VL11_9MICO|nr:MULTISPECIES: aminodeoxychorismate/anthranilate synthase component II [Georgenia]QDB77978.1 aminodeoxychorismate/anthranilate synthase component II [Georgenia wutianyii]TNC18184.1 aminodeoxychorismate/anthranilate synthase component II [Georgenia sp. 311]